MKITTLLLFMTFLFQRHKGQEGMTYDNPLYQKKLYEILGESSDSVLHAVIPFDMGWDIGGRADVYLFENHVDGIIYITGDLTGKKQKSSDAGNYELMVCQKQESDWGSDLISNLAYYTLESSINSGETMDLNGRFISNESKIVAIIFDKYADFKINGKQYGIMLIIGITKAELGFKKKNGSSALLKELKERKIYPFTDLMRNSIF